MKIAYEFRAEEEDISVRGNAMASGDDAADKAVEDEILARLDRGDIFAWFCAHVIARVEIDGVTYEGHDYLGGCSYANEADFVREDGYYPDMRREAYADLRRRLKEAVRAGERSGAVLKRLPVEDDSASKAPARRNS
jgi:hypothetical protein